MLLQASTQRMCVHSAAARRPVQRLAPPRSTAASYSPPSSATGLSELQLLQQASTVVPDCVMSGGHAAPTSAAVSFNLLRNVIHGEAQGLTPLENAIAAARTSNPDSDLQVEQAMANVAALLAAQVTGRVSIEVDPRLAHDTRGMIAKAQSLATQLKATGLGASRLLFRLPATWEGVQAAQDLQAAGLPTQLYLAYSLIQAVAAAQAGAALVTVNVGRTRDWYAKHPGVIRDPTGPRQDAGSVAGQGVDPGVRLVTDIYNYLKVHHPSTSVMATGLRSREDALALAGCDYLLLPEKVIDDLAAAPSLAGFNNGLSAAVSGDDPLADLLQLSPAGAVEAGPPAWPPVSETAFKERLGLAGAALLEAGLKDALLDVEALASLAKATTGRSST